MLVKNEKYFNCDAHFHYSDCLKYVEKSELDTLIEKKKYRAISCAHSTVEWKVQSTIKNLYLSFGLHPQSCIQEESDRNENQFFLEELCRNNSLNCIGEAGFDYFTQEFKSYEKEQESMWNICLDLALEYKLPLVVHCRKANNKLFEYENKLKKLPAVLFHSFMGPYLEAKSLLAHNVNAFFSFGKQVLNNNKKVIECVKKLPVETLLCETDAPYQYLKGEKCTLPYQITSIYDEFYRLRCENYLLTKESFFKQLNKNFESFLQLENSL